MRASAIPTLGVETELALLGRRAPRPERPARAVLEALRAHFVHIVSAEHAGAFFKQGLVYLDGGDILEICTWPASSPTALMRQEEALLALVRRGFEILGLGGSALCLGCFGEVPRALATPGAATLRGATLGHHLNLAWPGMERSGRRRVADLVGLLPEITGPGGFVRRRDGVLEYRRDPRAARVATLEGGLGLDGSRPLIRGGRRPERVEILGLGHGLGRADRLVRFGLLLLLAAGLQRRELAGAPVLAHPARSCGGGAGLPTRVFLDGDAGPSRASRGEILLRWLDHLESVAETPEGAAVSAREGLALARKLLEARRGEDWEPGHVPVPFEWLTKREAFRRVCAEEGLRLPEHGHRRRRPGPLRRADARLLERLAVVSIRAQDVLDGGARAWIVARAAERAPVARETYARSIDADLGRLLTGRVEGAAEPGPVVAWLIDALRTRRLLARASCTWRDLHLRAAGEGGDGRCYDLRLIARARRTLGERELEKLLGRS